MTKAPLPLLAIRVLLLLVTVATVPLRADSTPDLSKLQARPAPAWVRNAVIYEIFPRHFSPAGNFAGITAKLDELKDLGVDILWLMPIHPPGKLKAKGALGSPYAAQDYYAINPDYGTKDDLHRLVDGAHKRGMKVIIDIVANHTAWDSVMLRNPSFYKRNAAGEVIPPNPDWTDVAGLDYTNPETSRYMIDMLKYWMTDFHLDGFRCDVAAEVPTGFWEAARDELTKIKPDLFMLAEASKPELVLKAFDADYGWQMLNAFNQVLMNGASAADFPRVWAEERKKFPQGTLHMNMTDDHDEPRAISRFGWKAALAASAMTFCMDGLPILYNGMEVGDTTESGDPALFEKLTVFWAPKQREKFRATYQQLIALRHTHPALATNEVVWLPNSAPNDLVTFLRRDATEEIVFVANLSNRTQGCVLSLDNQAAFRLLLPSPAGATPQQLSALVLGAFEWRIYHRPLAE